MFNDMCLCLMTCVYVYDVFTDMFVLWHMFYDVFVLWRVLVMRGNACDMFGDACCNTCVSDVWKWPLSFVAHGSLPFLW